MKEECQVKMEEKYMYAGVFLFGRGRRKGKRREEWLLGTVRDQRSNRVLVEYLTQ
ncbi:hypothetical protein WN55_07566 [Dufourea novaeangliae]|uniref:Uncharacterized protein n=1 Tax=Dufourea novaeangliae TaxID=178035 RepID=A0A154PU28_DUFNO|nr:hypothetical protein WN55_07566 [Dufourea novaeangliae]